jgi:hypothetical protein
MFPNSSIRLGELSGSDVTNALHETIKAFNEAASRQNRTIVRLTWAILVLTLVMAADVVLRFAKAA